MPGILVDADDFLHGVLDEPEEGVQLRFGISKVRRHPGEQWNDAGGTIDFVASFV